MEDLMICNSCGKSRARDSIKISYYIPNSTNYNSFDSVDFPVCEICRIKPYLTIVLFYILASCSFFVMMKLIAIALRDSSEIVKILILFLSFTGLLFFIAMTFYNALTGYQRAIEEIAINLLKKNNLYKGNNYLYFINDKKLIQNFQPEVKLGKLVRVFKRRFINKVAATVHYDGLSLTIFKVFSKNKIFTCRWDEISQIQAFAWQTYYVTTPGVKFGAVHGPKNLIFKITDNTNKTSDWIGNEVVQNEELFSQVIYKSYPYLLSKTKRALDNGNWIQFGPISVNNDKIQYRNNEYLWDEIYSILIKEGLLHVFLNRSSKKRNFNIEIRLIPNVYMLFWIASKKIQSVTPLIIDDPNR